MHKYNWTIDASHPSNGVWEFKEKPSTEELDKKLSEELHKYMSASLMSTYWRSDDNGENK